MSGTPFVKMKLSKYALALVCGLGSISLHAEVLQKARETGVIKLGVRTDNGALSYAISQGEYGGFHNELCTLVVRDLEKQLGRKLEIQSVPVTSQNRLFSVMQGDVDMECGATTNNETRQKGGVAFAVTTYVEEVRVAVKANSGITSVAQLGGKSVATTAGTTSVTLLRKKYRSGADLREVSVSNDEQAFNLLATGQADAYAMDGQIVASFISNSKNPGDFKLLPEVLSVEPIAIMLPKNDPAFKKAVDDSLKAQMKSGNILKIYNKWFMEPIPPKQTKIGLPASAATKKAWAEPNDRPLEAYGNQEGRP